MFVWYEGRFPPQGPLRLFFLLALVDAMCVVTFVFFLCHQQRDNSPRYFDGCPRVSFWCFFLLQADATGGAATQSLRRRRKGRNDDELSGGEEGGSAIGQSEEQEDDSDDSGTCSWLLACPTLYLLFFWSWTANKQPPFFTMKFFTNI